MDHLQYNDTCAYTLSVSLYSMLHGISPSDSWPGRRECVQRLVSCVGWLDFSPMISTVLLRAQLHPSRLALLDWLLFHPGLPHQKRSRRRRVAHRSPVVYLRLKRKALITWTLFDVNSVKTLGSLGWTRFSLPAAISMEQSGGEPRLAARCSGLFPPNVHALTSAFNCKITRKPWASTNHFMLNGIQAHSYSINFFFFYQLLVIGQIPLLASALLYIYIVQGHNNFIWIEQYLCCFSVPQWWESRPFWKGSG